MSKIAINVCTLYYSIPGCYYKSKMDLVFLLDGSGSVGSSNFQRTTDFVQRIIEGFEVGHNASQFGLIVFSGYVRTDVTLNNNMNKDELINAAKATTYPKGGTDTAGGLYAVRRMCELKFVPRFY